MNNKQNINRKDFNRKHLEKKDLGRKGEQITVEFLKKIKYKIIEQNFTSRSGEIDIIAKDTNTNEIVFIEVKTRTNIKYGKPIEAVNKNKVNHILKTATYYIYIKKLEREIIRFDIIEIYIHKDKIKISHTKNIDI